MKAVVTGAGGFIGRAVLRRLDGQPQVLSMSGRDWAASLPSIDFAGATVIHLAARAHRLGPQDEALFFEDNARKTSLLAAHAAARGARAFVFASTIKVHGEETRDRPFTADDEPAPEDAYARSKLAAERELDAIAARGPLSVSIVRTPLVYGAGAGGNLARLRALCDSPWPLPFASVRNRRSFVHVDDLAELLLRCGEPARGFRVFLAAHPEPVSTPGLVATLRAALGRPPRLYRFPVPALEALATLAGQRASVHRLTRSLEVDASATRRELRWAPRVSWQQAVEEWAHGLPAGHRT